MESKIIAGVKPLAQFMDDGSFLMPEIPAVYRAIQALGCPAWVDYDYVLSLSGAAVRLSWQQGWASYDGLPNQSDLFFDGEEFTDIKLALNRLGVSHKLRRAAEVGIETARREITDSLDRGIPVLLTDRSVCVLGYDGDSLLGVSTYADQNQRETPHNYNRFDDWESEIQAYFIIESYAPRGMDRRLLSDTLETAVKLATNTRIDKLGDTALGISSFDALAEQLVWDESFEPLEPGKRYEGKISFPYDRPEGYYREDGARTLGARFWDGYCDFLCMLNGYSNFARFLERYAGVVPEWHEKLLEAATYYHAACDYSGKLWQYVTPDDNGVAKFKDKDVRYAFAAHMLRAKIFTVRAVEILQTLI